MLSQDTLEELGSRTSSGEWTLRVPGREGRGFLREADHLDVVERILISCIMCQIDLAN